MIPLSLRLEILASPPERLAAVIAAAFRAAPAGLPLQRCCDRGGKVDARDIAASVTRLQAGDEQISADVSVFFTEVVGGCSCHDDPVGHPACCRLRLQIDRDSAAARIGLLRD